MATKKRKEHKSLHGQAAFFYGFALFVFFCGKFPFLLLILFDGGDDLLSGVAQ